MADLGSYIDTFIPWIIVIIAIFILYRPLKEPLGELWGLIAKLFSFVGEKKEDAKELFSKTPKEIEYQ